MKIAITTAFYPSLGGIETVANLLAHEFIGAKHEVIVIATTPEPEERDRQFPFPIYYRPSVAEMAAIYRNCDRILQFNLGTKTLWPNMFAWRPVVISHQGIFEPGAATMMDRVKHGANGLFRKIAASSAVARHLRGDTTVIPNCYDPKLFFPAPSLDHATRDLICVARLIREKGVDLLVDALADLYTRGVQLTVTIVGDGPLRNALREQAVKRGVAAQIEFAGSRKPGEVAEIYRRHRVAIVPSRYEEAFGVVALEALACGCRVIAANRGGLPEALGECGVLFDGDSADALAEAIVGTVSSLAKPHSAADEKMLSDHLQRHSPAVVAARYLEVLRNAA